MQATQTSQMIKDATLSKVGDRYFIHGTGYVAKRNKDDAKYQWYEGIDVSFAWSTVDQYFTVTEDQVDKYLDSSEKASQ